MEKEESGTGRSEPVAAATTARDGRELSVPVFITRDGKSVFNRLDSHVAGMTTRYLKEAVGRISTRNHDYVVREIEFDHVIGYSNVVPVRPDEEFVWAQRGRGRLWSRFVLNRAPEPSNCLTVILLRAKEDGNTYIIISAWIGRKSGIREEDVKKLRGKRSKLAYVMEQDGREFWYKHAFVWGSMLIWPSSLRFSDPYENEQIVVPDREQMEFLSR